MNPIPERVYILQNLADKAEMIETLEAVKRMLDRKIDDLEFSKLFISKRLEEIDNDSI